MTSTTSRIVSSEDEPLILVDADDRQTGRLNKAECHNGDGTLHRAFSIFLFDNQGNLLLQKRAGGKRLWPGYWSNSCCSHPRDGETLDVAIMRRLQDELHTGCDLQFVYKFIYQVDFGDIGAEHELCHVFLGRVTGEPSANDTEIEAMRYLSAVDLEREFKVSPDAFTPWLKMEWRHLKEAHGELLATYTKVG